MSVLAADSYTVDPAHTFPGFEVNHLGFSNMHGSFHATSGKIVLDPSGSAGSIEAVIDMSSVSTGQARRDEHLRSADFFDVARYPSMSFKSTRLKYNGSNLESAEGQLTLHGVTRPVTLTMTHFHCAVNPINKKPTCGGNASAAIKRTEFGINAYVPAISDEVKISIEVEATKD
jgi:polyisoprenoid-binding protein YceI